MVSLPLQRSQPAIPFIRSAEAPAGPEAAVANGHHDSSEEVLLVAPEATAALGAINKPVAVVAIMGVARSGKSTFLNHALELLVSKNSAELIAAEELGQDQSETADSSKTFKTGDTCAPVTQGVDLSSLLVKLSTADEHPTLILDVEGLASLKHAGTKHDVTMVLIVMMLANCVLVNYNGASDLRNLAETLLVLAEGRQVLADAGQAMPKIIILCRDSLPDQTAPAMKTDIASLLAANPHTRTEALQVFLSADLMLVPTPLDSQASLVRLQQLGVGELDGRYQQVVGEVMDRCAGNMEPKTEGGHLTGPELLRLAEGCMARARSGELSRVPGSFAELQARLATEAIAEALGIFCRAFTADAERPGVTVDDLSQAYEAAKQKALDWLQKQLAKAGQLEQLQPLTVQLEVEWSGMLNAQVTRINAQQLQEEVETLEQQLKQKEAEVSLQQQQLAAEKQQLVEAKEEVRRAEEQVQEHEAKLTQLQRRVEEQQVEVQEQQQQVQEQRRHWEQQQRELEDQQERVRQLRQQVEVEQQHWEVQLQQVAAHERELLEQQQLLRARHEAMSAEHQRLRAEQQWLEEQQQRLQQHDRQLMMQQQAVQSRQQQLERQKQAVEAYKAEVEVKEQELQQQKQELVERQRRMSERLLKVGIPVAGWLVVATSVLASSAFRG